MRNGAGVRRAPLFIQYPLPFVSVRAALVIIGSAKSRTLCFEVVIISLVINLDLKEMLSDLRYLHQGSFESTKTSSMFKFHYINLLYYCLSYEHFFLH